MSDPTRPTGWSAADEPTVAVPAADGGGPPTAEHPLPADDGEPPRRNGWIAAIIVLLVLIIALLAFLLLDDEGDDGDDGDVTTTSSVVDTTTSTEATTTSSTDATTTSTTAPATTTTAASTVPRVLSLETSEFTCPGDLTLSWTTENAVRVEIAIDNPGGVFTEGPPNGSTSVPAPCDGDTQTYYVTAIAANGDRNTQELTLDS